MEHIVDYEHERNDFAGDVYVSLKKDIHNGKAVDLLEPQIKFILCRRLAYPSVFYKEDLKIWIHKYSIIIQEVYNYDEKKTNGIIKDVLDMLDYSEGSAL
jgi:hypothetical protein